MDATPQEKLALDELRRSYDVISRSSDTLDQKAGTLLSSAGLVTGLFTALQIALIGPDQSLLYKVGLLAILLLFLVLIALCTSIFWTKSYKIPLKADWPTIYTNVLSPPPGESTQKMIASYITWTSYNRRLNAAKAFRFRVASVLLFLIVASLVLISVVPTN